jgi:hypothetical protein
VAERSGNQEASVSIYLSKHLEAFLFIKGKELSIRLRVKELQTLPKNAPIFPRDHFVIRSRLEETDIIGATSVLVETLLNPPWDSLLFFMRFQPQNNFELTLGGRPVYFDSYDEFYLSPCQDAILMNGVWNNLPYHKRFYVTTLSKNTGNSHPRDFFGFAPKKFLLNGCQFDILL